MKPWLLAIFAILPLAPVSAGSGLALGLAATFDHETMSQTGRSDAVSDSDSIGLMFGFPIGDTWRSVATVSVTEQSVKDDSALMQSAPTDYWQLGLAAGLGVSYPLASTGPFAVRAGLSGTVGYWAPPSNASGTYRNVYTSLCLPVAATAAFAGNWVVQVSQPVMLVSAKWISKGGKDTSAWSWRMNTGFTPTVALLYNF
jgi:hypothetical protein